MKNFDNFIKLFTHDSFYYVKIEYESSIDAAVSKWVDCGRDTLLDLEDVANNTYKIKASVIESWIVSTKINRQTYYEFEKYGREEEKEMKATMGWFDENE